jgi:hypothetical protein
VRGCLFYDAFYLTDYVARNGKAIDKEWIGKDLQGLIEV